MPDGWHNDVVLVWCLAVAMPLVGGGGLLHCTGASNGEQA